MWDTITTEARPERPEQSDPCDPTRGIAPDGGIPPDRERGPDGGSSVTPDARAGWNGRDETVMRAAFALLCLTLPAAALDLPDESRLTATLREPLGSYPVPLGPWRDGTLPVVEAEGAVLRDAWQVSGATGTLDLLAPLRDQLTADGHEVLFSCDTDACGGFDFRFRTPVLPDPAMHVDLADFRFLSARRDAAGGPEYTTLLVSRRGGQGFVQIVRVVPAGGLAMPEGDLATKTPFAVRPDLGAPGGEGVIAALTEGGRAVLEGLRFETGSARLADDVPPVLEALADWLRADPERRVTLVGHTDADGAPEANLSLSRERARAVADRLVGDLGVGPDQVTADGVGFLVPLVPNDSDANRARNRRVEAVLLGP